MSSEQRVPWRTGAPIDRVAALRQMGHSSTSVNSALVFVIVALLFLLAATGR